MITWITRTVKFRETPTRPEVLSIDGKTFLMKKMLPSDPFYSGGEWILHPGEDAPIDVINERDLVPL